MPISVIAGELATSEYFRRGSPLLTCTRVKKLLRCSFFFVSDRLSVPPPGLDSLSCVCFPSSLSASVCAQWTVQQRSALTVGNSGTALHRTAQARRQTDRPAERSGSTPHRTACSGSSVERGRGGSLLNRDEWGDGETVGHSTRSADRRPSDRLTVNSARLLRTAPAIRHTHSVVPLPPWRLGTAACTTQRRATASTR